MTVDWEHTPSKHVSGGQPGQGTTLGLLLNARIQQSFFCELYGGPLLYAVVTRGRIWHSPSFTLTRIITNISSTLKPRSLPIRKTYAEAPTLLPCLGSAVLSTRIM